MPHSPTSQHTETIQGVEVVYSGRDKAQVGALVLSHLDNQARQGGAPEILDLSVRPRRETIEISQAAEISQQISQPW